MHSEGESKPGKIIVICSDGTGNKGGGATPTNVWRIRESIAKFKTENDKTQEDNTKKTEQIVIYQDGVGTQSTKAEAILGLTLSFGITQNLVHLYARLIAIYEPGDQIFLFGFSRGAFTIRSLALILELCGIANPRDEITEELLSVEGIMDLAEEAVSAYKLRHTDAAQKFREKYGHNHPDAADDLSKKGRFPIQFIGVWDTVSAVGLPFRNTTQWLLVLWRWVSSSKWFRKVQFSLLNWHRPESAFFRCAHEIPWREWDSTDDDLHENIQHAYHALAVDDERQAFRPMLWMEYKYDEQDEKVVKKDIKKRGGVQQVWFSGMHANVGGGYAKDHLAYVSLVWMMEHAAECGLAFEAGALDKYKLSRDEYGKLYDSRGGAGVYYRFWPRIISDFSREVGIDGIEDRLPLIHESVEQRIRKGGLGYAPNGIPLPDQYKLVGNLQSKATEEQASPVAEQTPVDVPVDSETKSIDDESAAGEQADKTKQQQTATPFTARTTALKMIQRYTVLRRMLYYGFFAMTIAFGWIGVMHEQTAHSQNLEVRAYQVVDLVLTGLASRTNCPTTVLFGLGAIGVGGALFLVWLTLRKLPLYCVSSILFKAVCAGILGFLFRPAIAAVVKWLVPAGLEEFMSGVLGSPAYFVVFLALFAFLRETSAFSRHRMREWNVFAWRISHDKKAMAPLLLGDKSGDKELLGVAIVSSVFEGVLAALAVFVMVEPFVLDQVRTVSLVGVEFDLSPVAIPAAVFGLLVVIHRQWRVKIADSKSTSDSTKSRADVGIVSVNRIPWLDRFVVPAVAIALVGLGLLYLYWVSASDAVTRMIVRPVASAVEEEPNEDPHKHQRSVRQQPAVFRLSANRIEPTRLYLNKGTLYVAHFNAGTWSDAGHSPDESNGIAREDEVPEMKFVRSTGLMRNSTENYFVLMGCIGSPTGTAFPIYDGVPFTVPESGDLFLFPNDSQGFYYNNTGIAYVELREAGRNYSAGATFVPSGQSRSD